MNIFQKIILLLIALTTSLGAFLYLLAPHRAMRVRSWIFGESFQGYPALLILFVGVVAILGLLYFRLSKKTS